PPAPATPRRAQTGSRASVPASRPFLLLAAALTLSAFALYAVVMGLVPLLLARGASPSTAAWALGLGGLGQTLGRTLYTGLAARSGIRARTATLITAGGMTTALLAAVPGPVPLLIALSVLAGTVRGNLTLLQATAVTDRWGTARYGRLSALLAAPVTIAGALAPWAGTALAPPLGGYPHLFAALAAVSAAATTLALAADRCTPDP
ncbi:MFS transporter, partial [Streptacidiphilus griseoplanus]|uniref:MFS transporter n=1 Tax=Peterkaempfera griseoplana TaxID=66896 RepID=UPI000A6A7D36